jgi:type IV secretory pathway ATPase VirB11/archaellum biosynthesis ATPase
LEIPTLVIIIVEDFPHRVISGEEQWLQVEIESDERSTAEPGLATSISADLRHRLDRDSDRAVHLEGGVPVFALVRHS